MSTLHPGSIVVGIDGSPSSGHALDWAIEEAARRHTPLHLLHALGLDPFVTAAMANTPEPSWLAEKAPVQPDTDDVLDAAVARVTALGPTLTVTTEVAQGDPAPRLVDLSRAADTVVVGSRGHGGARSAVLGSVSLQVSTHAHCPVAVVHAAPLAHLVRPRVVVGVDGSVQSDRAVEYAFAEASSRRIELLAVHTWWLEFLDGAMAVTVPTAQWERIEQEQRLVLSEALSGWREKYPDVTVHEQVRRAHPVEALVRESEDAELVVVGSRGRGGFTALVLGSVSHGVLHRAKCPVVVARNPGVAARTAVG
ncbi:MAG TPA: universal stress protein [Dermatophilaceae bacterium]|nr:universal stress protein [Dermatophilaceae bacterium]